MNIQEKIWMEELHQEMEPEKAPTEDEINEMAKYYGED